MIYLKRWTEKYAHSLGADALKRLLKDKIALIAFLVIISYILMALLSYFGVIFSQYSLVDNSQTYFPPSRDHWFGTDLFGRDVMARAAHGTITALMVGSLGTGIALSLGTALGAIAGYFGGRIDDLIVWLYTTVDTIPYILLVVAFAFVIGPSVKTMYLAIGLTYWVGHCRIVRSEFIKHRDREYVQSARALGASHARCIWHILPNVSHVILINFSLGFVSAIKSEVILSYLGLGVEPGVPSWGVMINDARLELSRGVWWNLTAATVFMFFLVLAINLFNDALRDALDPKLKNK